MRDSTENQIMVLLIRHGTTRCNIEKRYCGKASDEDLTDEEIESVKKKAVADVYPFAEIVFCSPKKRALHTANIIYPDLNPVVIGEFDEIDFGEFEGKNYEELKDSPEYRQWIDSGGENRFPEGESREEYCKRVKKGFLKALEETMRQNAKSMGIIGHGGTIMALLSMFAGKNYYDCMVGNSEGFLCGFSPDTGMMKVIRKIQ